VSGKSRRRGEVSKDELRRQQAAQASRRRWMLGAGAAAAIIAVALGVALLRGSGGGASSVTDTTSWQLPSLSGSGTVRLADFRGKPTVVNFFASWCTECQAELPGFARVSKEFTGKVQFVGVNSEDNGNGQAMASQFAISWWPIARDTGGQAGSGLHDALGGQGMPLTAFYDAGGKLVDENLGRIDEQALRQKLSTLYNVQ
jgi:thiol-disulfide isomerase/thioredoxin